MSGSSTTTSKKATSKKAKRKYTQSPVAYDHGVKCPYCRTRFGHKLKPGGNKNSKIQRCYMICGGCGQEFVKLRLALNIPEGN